jgi:Ser/Thr protein kinase RdoA (MazF antagonist)
MVLPTGVDAISGDWLTRALAEAGVIAEDGPISFECRRIGADRGFTSEIGLVRWRRGEASGTVVVKLPDDDHPFERSVREVRFYETLAPEAGIPVPRPLHLAVDDDASRVAMLLEAIDGRAGDVLEGCGAAEARMIVAAVARMHARWWRHPALDRHAWLPRWGRGEADAPRPHRRRAERYRRRLGPFMAGLGADAPRDLVTLAQTLSERLEEVLASLAALPPTLIHADLHLDNVVFPSGSDPRPFVLLDWQSVSAGPGAYDLVRFLAESLDETLVPGAVPELVRLYHDALADAGVDAGPYDAFERMAAAIASSVLAGYVSGYGGRAPETLGRREHAMIARAMSSTGLGGVVLALTRGRVTTAPPPRPA